MNVEEAARATVQNFQGGAEALAPRVGIGAQVLRNKLNTNNERHHLTLAEAVRIMRVTGDLAMVHALADEFGGIFIPVVQGGDARSAAVLSDISTMSAEFGDLIREVAGDISDGVVTKNELDRIANEANGLRRALGQLMADLTAMHQQSTGGDAASRPHP
jgi:hypothetical protein